MSVSVSSRGLPYSPIITHDVDRYFKWKKFKSIFGETSRILQGKSSWRFKEAWTSFLNRNNADPFSNLLSIAELDNEAGVPSVFYIMTTEEKHPLNISDYSVGDSKIQKVLKELVKSGSEIGIHPGILTFDDAEKMKEQKSKLEDCIGEEVHRSRQHYLKYEYPKTFKILESVGIRNDSSILVDLDRVEDPKQRTTYTMYDEVGNNMNITQTPLVFMDTHHMSKSSEEVLAALEKSLAIVKRDGGEVMILWHNNFISNTYEIGLYKEALQVVKRR